MIYFGVLHSISQIILESFNQTIIFSISRTRTQKNLLIGGANLSPSIRTRWNKGLIDINKDRCYLKMYLVDIPFQI